MDAVEYQSRAMQHAPKTAAEQKSEARRLARHGYGDYAIAQALKVSVEMVRRFLGKGA
jgi:hypothetical protein